MITAIVQARMGSTRLPGKVIKEICGKPMLWHQLQRIQRSRLLEQILVATTDRTEDQPIVDLVRESGFTAVTGSVDDVLDRYYRAAQAASASSETPVSTIVRLTGDCPLIEPQAIDQVIQYFLDHREEIDHVCLDPKWPDGFGVEAFSFSLLAQAWREADKQYEREHVTPYIYLSGKFRCHRIACEQDLSGLRLTVDEATDFEVVNSIYQELYPEHGHSFGLDQILQLRRQKPGLFEPNSDIIRNARFIKAIGEERKVLRYDPEPLLTKSRELGRRAQALTPGQTRRPDLLHLGHGKGSRVWDLDGNEYVDHQMGCGAAILGHAYPIVTQAVRLQFERVTSLFGLSPLKVELAELVASQLPWVEMAQFGTSPALAKTAAIGACRAHTGREKILYCGFHDGPTAKVIDFHYNDLPAVESMFSRFNNEIAAVVLEPYCIETEAPGLSHSSFLADLKSLAHSHGALVIYDETSTGFRFGLGAFQEAQAGPPDLACFGGSMANGMSIAAVAGPREYMKYCGTGGEFSATRGLELPMAAATATLRELGEQNVHAHIWEMGSRLIEGYKWLVHDLQMDSHTWMAGLPPLSIPVFRDTAGNDSPLMASVFQQENLKRGVLFGGPQAISFSHTIEDIDMTLAAYYQALEVIKHGLQREDLESLLEDMPLPLAQGCLGQPLAQVI